MPEPGGLGCVLHMKGPFDTEEYSSPGILSALTIYLMDEFVTCICALHLPSPQPGMSLQLGRGLCPSFVLPVFQDTARSSRSPGPRPGQDRDEGQEGLLYPGTGPALWGSGTGAED